MTPSAPPITTVSSAPPVGLGYRIEASEQIGACRDNIETLEITLDHYLWGGVMQRRLIEALVGDVPLVAHGVGLSLGTDTPPDPWYLEKISALLERFKMPYYSEHIAFTGVPDCELSNLLPLPKTEAVAEQFCRNVEIVQSFVSVPLVLENITYYWDWPESELGDADFISLICGETGAKLLLDVENLYLNATNHHYDAREFIDALAPSLVQAVHMAGGIEQDGMLIDTHDHPAPDETLALLAYLLERQSPQAIILERDRRLEAFDEVMADLVRIRACVANAGVWQRGEVEGV